MARVMSEFSEDEQNRLVAEYEQLPRGGRGEWLKAQGVTGPSFYERRARVLKTQAPKRGRPAGSKNKPAADLFADADEATQRRLMAAYSALPDREKAGWRDTHKLTPAMVSYYLRKFANAPPSNGVSTALARRHEAAIAEIPVIPTRPPNGSSIDPTIHLPTFDDAVSVIKVRRDMYNQIYSDIINDLQRMKQ